MVMYFGNSPYSALAVSLVMFVLHCPVDADVMVKAFDNKTLQNYVDQPASQSFGTPFPGSGLWGHLFYTEPEDGCTPVEQPAGGFSWIAVVSMSEKCEFDEQVWHAQIAGFVGVIVHNNENDDLIEMKNASRHLSIPSTFVGLSSSNLLAQFNRRLDFFIVIVEHDSSYTKELLLIIFAGVSSFSAVVVLGIVIGLGIHNCCRNRSHLLSRWKLKRLHVHVFKKGDLYENCAICLEDYSEADKLRVLPCAHAFHSKCIDVWLTKNRKTCPLCNDTVNPSRRKSNRASSLRNQDGENRPLLTSFGSDDSIEPAEENAALLTCQSTVVIHEEPVSFSTSSHRNYGTAGPSDLLTTADISELDGHDGDSLFSAKFVGMFDHSPLHRVEAEPDGSTLLTSSETEVPSSGEENEKLVKIKHEVFVANNIPVHDDDNIA